MNEPVEEETRRGSSEQARAPEGDDARVSSATRAHGQRWGIILAGGYGTHLLALTRLLTGDERPKQYCRFARDETLLEQTRQRVEECISASRIVFALMRAHRPFFLQEPGIPSSQRIVQPSDKGTAPPIVYSLLSIFRQDPEATVAIVPCDHYYSDGQAFTSALESAFHIAARHRNSVVVLGSEADSAQNRQGWIELGRPVDGVPGDCFHVRSFCEKPSPRFARQFLRQGALWNMSVMAGSVNAFLEMARDARVGLADAFRDKLWDGLETNIADDVYKSLYTSDFSRDVLSVQPQRLMALRHIGGRWNDLRDPDDVIDVLRTNGIDAPWMKEWQAARNC